MIITDPVTTRHPGASKMSSATGEFVCPVCRGPLAGTEGNSFECRACARRYPVRDGIPVFTQQDEYWCNVDRTVMHDLIRDSEESGDWIAASRKHVPACMRHFEPLFRGDAQFVFPVNRDARVLDAGSMWGGITVPLAQFVREVHAVDKTWETLRFLQVRARQLRLDNIHLAVSSIHQLPYPDDFFDCITLNGVLEWLGTDEEIILDRDWDGRSDHFRRSALDPEEMQARALGELQRVLKKGGSIYIAIENRIGLQYFLGLPDDHINIPFVTFLPRWLANAVTKIIRNREYRTYIYTPWKLKELVRRAGFSRLQLFSVYPHYNIISRMTPFGVFDRLGGVPASGDAPLDTSGRVKVFLFSCVWRLLPNPVRKYFSPSLALIAFKGEEPAVSSRLLQQLVDSAVIPADRAQDFEPALMTNRFANHNTVNVVICERESTRPIKYLCKVARSADDVNLATESEMLRHLGTVCAGRPFESSVPALVFSGAPDGVPIQVTKFLDIKPVNMPLLDGLRRIDKFLPMAAHVPRVVRRSVRRLARKAWLSRIDPVMRGAVEWLVAFQDLTHAGDFNLATDYDGWLAQVQVRMTANGFQFHGDRAARIGKALKGQPQAVPVTMRHGDFDICNVFRGEKGLVVLDFEHGAKRSLPFFDLANLIFSPLILEWRCDSGGLDLAGYARATEWERYIVEWVNCYRALSKCPREVLRYLPALGVMEQCSVNYPKGRDPFDYPMYAHDILGEMLAWELEL